LLQKLIAFSFPSCVTWQFHYDDYRDDHNNDSYGPMFCCNNKRYIKVITQQAITQCDAKWMAKSKNIFHANNKQKKKKKVQWREKNVYLEAIACDDHCNGHDDNLVATKNHHNAHDDNPTTTKNRL
jgi:hypothetical protein